MAEEQNRCWPGYEPVPGKKPHSQGSCKPKAESKSTPADKDFRAKRRQQLDHWQAEHAGRKPSGAQHLKAPSKGASGAKGKQSPAKKKTATAKTANARATPKTRSTTKTATKRASTRQTPVPRKAATAKKTAAAKRSR